MTAFDSRALTAAMWPIKTVDSTTWRQWGEVAQQLPQAKTLDPLLCGMQHISNIICNQELEHILPGERAIADLREEWKKFSSGLRDPASVLAYLDAFFVDRKKFTGERNNFNHPHNSCIDKVIEKKTGSPIVLSTLYMALARDSGIMIKGCALPGRFCVMVNDGRSDLIIDPFDGGRILDRRDIEEIVFATYGIKELKDEDLVSATPRIILTRLCRNLMSGPYSKRGHEDKVTKLLSFQTVLWPDRAPLFTELGWLLFTENRRQEAGEAFRRFLYLKKEELVGDQQKSPEVERVMKIMNVLP